MTQLTEESPLYEMLSSLRTIIDNVLPNTFLNDCEGFETHCNKTRGSCDAQRNEFKHGMKFAFDVLRVDKEWHSRNRQYTKLVHDKKNLSVHINNLKTSLSNALDGMEVESDFRRAVERNEVGTFEVTNKLQNMAKDLSRPSVPLEVIRPDNFSMSIYCDSFVLDATLSDGNGTLKSASLSTVSKGGTKQFEDRDQDLYDAICKMEQGDQSNLRKKIRMLVHRAELAKKYNSVDFESLEETALSNLQEGLEESKYWKIHRVVEGLRIIFSDPYQINQLSSSDDPAEFPSLWCASITFSEYAGNLCLEIVADTPLCTTFELCKQMVLHSLVGMESKDGHLRAGGDRAMLEVLKWRKTRLEVEEGLDVALNTSIEDKEDLKTVNVVLDEFDNGSEVTYTCSMTSGVPGMVELHAFPLTQGALNDPAAIRTLFLVLTQALVFDSLRYSCFSSAKAFFGCRGSSPSNNLLNVDVSLVQYPKIVFKFFSPSGAPQQLSLMVKPAGEIDCSVLPASSSHSSIGSEMLSNCHSVPLVLHFFLIEIMHKLDTEASEEKSDLINETLMDQETAKNSSGMSSLIGTNNVCDEDVGASLSKLQSDEMETAMIINGDSELMETVEPSTGSATETSADTIGRTEDSSVREAEGGGLRLDAEDILLDVPFEL